MYAKLTNQNNIFSQYFICPWGWISKNFLYKYIYLYSFLDIDADAARNVEVNRLMAFIKENTDNINEKYRTSLDPKTGGTCLHIAAAKGYIEVMNDFQEVT